MIYIHGIRESQCGAGKVLCKRDDPLKGICTKDCKERENCFLPRAPLLIHAVIIKRKKGEILEEAYINELVYEYSKLKKGNSGGIVPV